jgi:hypothetical protein
MLPCLSHLTYTKKMMHKNNKYKHNNKHNNKHNKMTPQHVFEHQGSSYALNVHTIAQLDFILFQQVF